MTFESRIEQKASASELIASLDRQQAAIQTEMTPENKLEAKAGLNLKRWFQTLSVPTIALLMSACDNPDKHPTVEGPDRFDKAAQHVDDEIARGREAQKKQGLPSDAPVFWRNVEGQDVKIVPGSSVVPESSKPEPETKTNSALKDF